MLVLERSDPAALIGISLREMEKGGGAGRAPVASWRWMGAGQVSAEVGLMVFPTLEPAIGGGDGKQEVSLVPNSVKRSSLSDSANQFKKLAGGDTGAGDEVTPKNGEGSTTAFAAVAIGAKKRKRLTSRWWLWAQYPVE